MDDKTRNDPKKFSNYQLQELVRQQISSLLLQYPELEEDEVLRTDMVEGETDAFELLRRLERKRQEADNLVNALVDNLSELRLRQMRFQNREAAMRRLMFEVMQIARIQKAELPEATLSIRNNPPKIIITDEAAVPDMYTILERKIQKIKLKDDLIQGYTISGAELSNQEPSLSIRTK